MQLIAEAIVMVTLGITLGSVLGAIGGSGVDLTMIAGALVVIGGALALGLAATVDPRR
jgi:hypothetical protein